MTVDPLFNLLRRRYHHVHVFSQRETQIFGGPQIERIDQRNLEGAVVSGNR